MGYLKERIFLTESTNNYYVDIAVSNSGEELWWYCDKNRDTYYSAYLDQENRERLFIYMGDKFSGDTLEDKLKSYIKATMPEDITLHVVDLFKESGIEWHPGLYNHPKLMEEDPHHVMSDRESLFDILNREDRCKNLLFEMIMNSVEEFQIGKGTTIAIKKSGSVYEIKDDGSGIPVEHTDEFKDYEWQRIFIQPKLRHDYYKLLSDNPEEQITVDMLLNSKYDKSKYYKECPRFSYKHTRPKGEFYPGSTLAHAQCYAKTMKIETVRSNRLYAMEFADGYCVKERTIMQENTREVGTHIIWAPSECCFKSVDIPVEDIISFVDQQALLNPGLKFVVSEGDMISEIQYSDGAKAYISAKAENLYMPIVTRKFDLRYYAEGTENHEELEISISFALTGFQESYHNYRRMNYGSTVDHIVEDVTAWLNDFTSHSVFVINNKEFKGIIVSKEAIENSLCLVVDTHSEYSSYLNEAMNGLDYDLFRATIKTAVRNILSNLFCGGDEDTVSRSRMLFTDIL